ncbi:MAG: hypothetical protein R2865_06365 [Deinococcales bacterium]
MGDADDSYDFAQLDPFVDKLRAGFQLVMGNRFKGGIQSGAMPPLHRYLGNPVLSFIGRLLFKTPVGDFHCGLRGFDKMAIEALNLQTTGMEFASELIVKASLNKLKITEVPTTLSPDGRSRPPHLRSWRDGWRHLRFLLLHSPRWLFIMPGIVLFFPSTLLMLRLLLSPLNISGITLDIHSLLIFSALSLVGFQLLAFGIFARIYSSKTGILPPSGRLEPLITTFSLEYGLISGLILGAFGLIIFLYSLMQWAAQILLLLTLIYPLACASSA